MNRLPMRPRGDRATVAASTRLHLRFAAATLAVMATAGGALLWCVRHQEVQQAEHNVSMHARYVVKSTLRDELTPGDLQRPVSVPRRKQLDWLFNARGCPSTEACA